MTAAPPQRRAIVYKQSRPPWDQRLSPCDGPVPRRAGSRRSVRNRFGSYSSRPTTLNVCTATGRPCPRNQRFRDRRVGSLTSGGCWFLKSLEAPRHDSRKKRCDRPGRRQADRTERARKYIPVPQVFGNEGVSRRITAARRRLFASRGRPMGHATGFAKRMQNH